MHRHRPFLAFPSLLHQRILSKPISSRFQTPRIARRNPERLSKANLEHRHAPYPLCEGDRSKRNWGFGSALGRVARGTGRQRIPRALREYSIWRERKQEENRGPSPFMVRPREDEAGAAVNVMDQGHKAQSWTQADSRQEEGKIYGPFPFCAWRGTEQVSFFFLFGKWNWNNMSSLARGNWILPKKLMNLFNGHFIHYFPKRPVQTESTCYFYTASHVTNEL
jgi:hypothetical protein